MPSNIGIILLKSNSASLKHHYLNICWWQSLLNSKAQAQRNAVKDKPTACKKRLFSPMLPTGFSPLFLCHEQATGNVFRLSFYWSLVCSVLSWNSVIVMMGTKSMLAIISARHQALMFFWLAIQENNTGLLFSKIVSLKELDCKVKFHWSTTSGSPKNTSGKYRYFTYCSFVVLYTKLFTSCGKTRSDSSKEYSLSVCSWYSNTY